MDTRDGTGAAQQARKAKWHPLLVAVWLCFAGLLATPYTSPAVGQSQDLSQTVAALLASNPNGGDQLAQAIHDLVLVNPAALNIIVAVVKVSGNDAQQSAIGLGLGLAAQDAVKADNQQLAVAIQTAVAASGMPQAVTAYAAAAGDAIIAAIGSGGSTNSGKHEAGGARINATLTSYGDKEPGFGLYGYLLITASTIPIDKQCAVLLAFLNSSDYQPNLPRHVPKNKRSSLHLFTAPMREDFPTEYPSIDMLRGNYDFTFARSLISEIYTLDSNGLKIKYEARHPGIFLAFRREAPLTEKDKLADDIVDLSDFEPAQLLAYVNQVQVQVKGQNWKLKTVLQEITRLVTYGHPIASLIKKIREIPSKTATSCEQAPAVVASSTADTKPTREAATKDESRPPATRIKSSRKLR